MTTDIAFLTSLSTNLTTFVASLNSCVTALTTLLADVNAQIAADTGETITGISPTSGPAGTALTITGTGFGATQGTGSVVIGSAATTVTTWSDTSIVIAVPSGLITGTQGAITVTNGTGGTASYGPAYFTVTVGETLSITSISPTSGIPGSTITLTGTGFGATQGTGYVVMGGSESMPVTSWSDTSIVGTIPTAFTSGNEFGIVMLNNAGAETSYGPPYYTVT